MGRSESCCWSWLFGWMGWRVSEPQSVAVCWETKHKKLISRVKYRDESLVRWQVIGGIGAAKCLHVSSNYSLRQPEEQIIKRTCLRLFRIFAFNYKENNISVLAEATVSQPIRMKRKTKKCSVMLWKWKESQQNYNWNLIDFMINGLQ